MKKKYASEIMEAIHEEAEALYEVGAIGKERMAEYDHTCLISQAPKTPKAVKAVPPIRGIKPATPVYAHH